MVILKELLFPTGTDRMDMNQLGIGIKGHIPTNILVDEFGGVVMEVLHGQIDGLSTTPEMEHKLILVIPNTDTSRALCDLL